MIKVWRFILLGFICGFSAISPIWAQEDEMVAEQAEETYSVGDTQTTEEVAQDAVVEEETPSEEQEETPSEEQKVTSDESAADESTTDESAAEDTVEESTGDAETTDTEQETSTESEEETTDTEQDQQESTTQEESVAEDVAQEEAPQPELGPDEIMGIDTVDLEDPQGNWLYKRVWWERAEAKYEKIRTAVNSILEQRTSFFAKRADLDKNVLDPFYIKVGLSQGEMLELVGELISRLKKEEETKQNEELLERAKADRKTLEQLEADVQKVVKQDEEVENAIMLFVEQINKIRTIEQDAWNDFKTIARVLDDKKARELFYKVDGAWRNIQELQSYIKDKFSESFDQLIERVKEQVSRIDTLVFALKDRGVDLKQRVIHLLDEKAVHDEDDAQDTKEESQTFIERYVTGPLYAFFSKLWELLSWPYHKIMGTTFKEDDSDDITEDMIDTDNDSENDSKDNLEEDAEIVGTTQDGEKEVTVTHDFDESQEPEEANAIQEDVTVVDRPSDVEEKETESDTQIVTETETESREPDVAEEITQEEPAQKAPLEPESEPAEAMVSEGLSEEELQDESDDESSYEPMMDQPATEIEYEYDESIGQEG